MYEALLQRADHPSADQIYDQVRTQLPGMARTTVYRILDTLVELGLVNRICHPGSAARFDAKTSRHHHLVCMVCESIFDLEDARFDELPLPDVSDRGFLIRDYNIHFRGICARCRADGSPQTSTEPPKVGAP